MKNFIFYSLVLGCLLYNSNATAQSPIDIAYHAMPASVTIDMPEEIVQIAGNAQSAMNQSMQIVMTAKTDATNLQQAATASFNNISSGAMLMAMANPGQGEYTFCGKSMEKAKVKDIAKKLKKTILTTKSKDWEVVEKQREIKKKFYMDNIYAIYAASLILQQQLKTDIKPMIDKAIICADGKGDACGIPATDSGGNNEVLFTYGQTLKSLDSIIRLWENVTALKARLVAIEAINTTDIIYSKTKEENKASTPASGSDKQSSTSLDLQPQIFKLHQSEPLVFAQVSYKGVASSLSNVEAAVAGNKSQALNLVKQTVNFVVPAENTKQHPIAEASEKIEALSEVSAVEDTVVEAMNTHNMLKELAGYKETAEQYAQMQKDYEAELARLQASEQCAIRYLGRYFSDPIKVWSGINLSKKPYNHEKRTGISGWAYEAFETAKAAETSTITTEDIAVESFDAKTKADLLDDPDFSKSRKQAQKLTTTLSTSKQEKAQEENRKASLTSWQIGAEAAKMLGADGSKWGSAIKKKMIWTDTKNFYQQYLRRKYDNVKSYLKVYTRDDVLALVISKLKGKQQDISETKYQKKRLSAIDQAAQKLSASLNDASTSVKEVIGKSNATIASLKKKREALVAQMDKLSDEMKEDTTQVSDIRAVAEEKAQRQLDETLNAKVVFPSSGLGSATKIQKMTVAEMNTAISKNEKAALDDKKITELNQAIKKNQSKLESYQAQLEKLDKQIAETKLAAQENAADTLEQKVSLDGTIKEALDNDLKLDAEKYASDVRKNLMAILSASALANPLLNPVSLMAMAEEAADSSLDALYKQVDAAVDGGYQQMLALGDDLYDSTSHERLVELHNQIINQVKGLTLAYSVAGLVKVDNIAVYAKLATVDTTAETEGFFVGATAKARDLKAPYAIPNFDLPPVREVFHFDAVDFAAVKPKVQGKTSGRSLSAQDFLNFGGDIPLIWQYMLKDDAFIESRYNLKEALSSGCEDVAFSRGGIMPCVVEGSSVVLDVNSKGEYLKRSDISASSLPKCLLVKTKNGKPHHVFMDADVVFAQPATNLFGKITTPLEKPAPRDCVYSELGMLLEADGNNNLKFKERAFEAYNDMLENTGGNPNDKRKNKIASANHAMLSRNQIGDFLRHAETEKVARDNLEEYKRQYEEQMDGLKKRLEAYGFKPAASFNLAKDSDYKLAVNKLQSIKNQKAGQASSAIAKVKIKDNAPAQEKSSNYKKLISLMKKDKDGDMKISITTADANDVDAQLKKAKADNAVVDKYKKSLKKEAQNYNNSDDAYCANY